MNCQARSEATNRAAMCVHVCMHACMRACICAYVHACVRACVCVRDNTYNSFAYNAYILIFEASIARTPLGVDGQLFIWCRRHPGYWDIRHEKVWLLCSEEGEAQCCMHSIQKPTCTALSLCRVNSPRAHVHGLVKLHS